MGPGPNQWSEYEVKMAMALLGKNRHYLARDIQRRHFNSTAKKVGYDDNAEPLLQEFIARTSWRRSAVSFRTASQPQ